MEKLLMFLLYSSLVYNNYNFVLGVILDDAPPLTSVDSNRLMNSSLSCTQGAVKTHLNMRCKSANGTVLGLLAVKRVFYGAVPLTNECIGLFPPKENCCPENALNTSCIFESGFELDTITKKCSGQDSCRLFGTNAMSRRGDCDQSVFSSITSFSFAEFRCIATGDLHNMCPSEITTGSGIQLHLNTNYEHKNQDLDAGDDCTCIVTTKCGANVLIRAEIMQLRSINSTDCVEEIFLQDLKNASSATYFSCKDHPVNGVLNNRHLFQSVSNGAVIKLHLFERHTGKVILSVRSSDTNSSVEFKCGKNLNEATYRNNYRCQNDVVIPETTSLVPSSLPTTETTTLISSLPTTAYVNEKSTLENGNNVTPVIVHQTEALHSGAIAGIVLSCLGIILVIFQGIFCFWRRHTKKTEVRADDETTTSGGTSVGFQNQGYDRMNSDSFNSEIFDTINNDDDVTPENVYDMAVDEFEATGESENNYEHIAKKGQFAMVFDNELYGYGPPKYPSRPPSYKSDYST